MDRWCGRTVHCMSSDADIAVAVDSRGRRTPLGEFVFALLTDSDQSISEVARRANLSRSFLYLLRDDRQVPSLDTLIALFEAIGVDEVRVGEVGERGDLAVRVNDREWWIRLPQDNKRAARSRSALQSLTTGGSFDELPGGMAAMASAPPAGASSYDRDYVVHAPTCRRRPQAAARRAPRDSWRARSRAPRAPARARPAAGPLDLTIPRVGGLRGTQTRDRLLIGASGSPSAHRPRREARHPATRFARRPAWE